MEDTDLNWRKASYSSNGGGNCVEVADHGNRVLVRDTKDRTTLMLRFTPGAWRRFADQVKRSLTLILSLGSGRRNACRVRSRDGLQGAAALRFACKRAAGRYR
jgi:hypothetical protein